MSWSLDFSASFDQYFQRQVTQDARRHLATPFVMVMPDGVIGGVYTLSSTALRLGDLPEDVARRLPRYPLVPATLIGRLAIDRRCHGQGWGSFLFLDALYRCSHSQVASFAVIVDALDDEARDFYVKTVMQAFAGLPVPLVPAHERHRHAVQMIGKDSNETTAAQVTTELLNGAWIASKIDPPPCASPPRQGSAIKGQQRGSRRSQARYSISISRQRTPPSKL
jgi:hypothetical protein